VRSVGTPLLYATLREVLSERAGVVNLGLEGVMLVGAVVGFVARSTREALRWALSRRRLAGGLFNLVFASWSSDGGESAGDAVSR
jgi:simple sugar transport system permease protein